MMTERSAVQSDRIMRTNERERSPKQTSYWEKIFTSCFKLTRLLHYDITKKKYSGRLAIFSRDGEVVARPSLSLIGSL